MAVLGVTSAAFAAATANDTASNYAPSLWSTTPPNLGSGFGGWSITAANNTSPPYVGTYLDNASPIISDGNSWGTYANGGNNNGILTIVRPFLAGGNGSASLYNQTFSFDLSSGGIGDGSGGPPNSYLDVDVGNAFTFEYLGTGSDNFLFNGASTPVNFFDLNSGMIVSLAVSGALNSTAEDYTFTVSPFLGGSPLFTTSGTFDSSVGNTSAFTYIDSNTTGNGYFNNLDITASVPEPASAAFVGLFGFATLLAVRRRK